jgi:hypothetical protein
LYKYQVLFLDSEAFTPIFQINASFWGHISCFGRKINENWKKHSVTLLNINGGGVGWESFIKKIKRNNN